MGSVRSSHVNHVARHDSLPSAGTPVQRRILISLAILLCPHGLTYAATGSGGDYGAAPVGGNYELSRQVIAGGGQRCSGGSYALIGTVAQAHAGTTPALGASYRLSGGFHIPMVPLTDELFRNGFEN
jgi:hypothetical protein